MKEIAILGTRGLPAAHGGFETFAEHFSLYLAGRGWKVTVYCQEDAQGKSIREEKWNGIRQIIIPVNLKGALGTMEFDWRSIHHLLDSPQKFVLTLGYNTASFCLPFRFKGIRNIINMDGLEWKREKWRFYERAWLWLNERCGCWFGDHLVADHPEIAKHLYTRVSSRKVTTIPYGASEVLAADVSKLEVFNLEPRSFATVIARPEPENSMLEIVKAFSRKCRGYKLIMLGRYQPEQNPFHKAVIEAASEDVLFPGAIYDKAVVEALRFYSRLYIHGHQVGGTNPSLVEALGAGTAVLAHNNRFNRWVAGNGAQYFSNEDECAGQLDALMGDDTVIEEMQLASRSRFHEAFTWDKVLGEYERLLEQWRPGA